MNPGPSLEERCICCGNPNEEDTESTIKEISERHIIIVIINETYKFN
jgi:hypothetical protein